MLRLRCFFPLGATWFFFESFGHTKYTHVCMDVCTYISMYIQTYICIYVRIHIYIYLYIYTGIYIHIYTHIHTHIYTWICDPAAPAHTMTIILPITFPFVSGRTLHARCLASWFCKRMAAHVSMTRHLQCRWRYLRFQGQGDSKVCGCEWFVGGGNTLHALTTLSILSAIPRTLAVDFDTPVCCLCFATRYIYIYVFIFVCIYVNVCKCIRVYMSIHIFMLKSARKAIFPVFLVFYMWIHIYTYIYFICVYIYDYIFMYELHICLHIHVNIWVYIHVFVCTYVIFF